MKPKFRGFSKKLNCWIYGDLIHTPEKKVRIINHTPTSFDGLKWCNINEFQDELNRENPENPRFFEDMKFSFSEKIADKVNQIYEKIRN